MQGLNEQIIGILRTRRDAYVRLVESHIAESVEAGGLAYSKSEAGQMIDGLLALLIEGLEGKGDEVRSFYLATLIPSIVEQGHSREGVIESAARYIMLLVHDVAEHLPADSRDAAVQWFAKFYGAYLAQLAGVALGVKAP